ncbi:hypothetical protein DL93DRAFT_267229 [Clavulina sp. PMI_390]|nr:hypothetical protein DL93DRAFT_267229 [Clavulina sp. PMI_390]
MSWGLTPKARIDLWLVLSAEQHSDAIAAWILARDNERYGELDVVRSERIEDLKNHLEDHGYSRKLLDAISIWTYRSMPTMGQSKRLTGRVWAEKQNKILPQVENALESLRGSVKRMAYSCAALAIRENCIRRLPTVDYLPLDNYSAYSPWPTKIQSLLDQWALGDGFDAFLRTRQDESPPPDLPPEIPLLVSELIDQCSQRVRDHFHKLIHLRIDLPPLLSQSETLNLAIVVFKTPGHSWFRRGLPYRALRYTYSPLYDTNGEIGFKNLRVWWLFDDVGSTIIRKMVTLHGLDPGTCTHDDLDNAVDYVVCETCGNMAMHWESALRHWETIHPDEGAESGAWRCLSVTEKANFHPIWTGMQAPDPQDRCTLCDGLYTTGPQFMQHLVSEHSDIVGDNPNPRQYSQRIRRWLYETAIEWAPATQEM